METVSPSNSAAEHDLPPALAGHTDWPWTAPPPAVEPARPWPRITVVTPSYNQGPYLEETIRSVLLQGYPNLEYRVIDGGSTDESVPVIRKYAPWLDCWVSELDRGQSHAIEKGFAHATGTILAWLNSDDLYEPGTLLAIGRHFLEHPQAVLIYGDAKLINRDGSARKDRPSARAFDRQWLLEHSNLVPQPAAFFRADAFRAAGGLDEDLHYVMDWDLWLRLGAAGPADFIPRSLARMRIYPEAKYQAGGRLIHAELRRVIERHGGRGLPAAVRRQLAQEQLAAALDAYRRQDFAGGQAELAYLFQNAPEWGGDTRRLAQAIAESGWRAFLAEAEPPLNFARQVSAHLPPEAGPADAVRRQALGLLYEALALFDFKAGRSAAARRQALGAMRADSRQLSNRGLWSLLARSFLPRRQPARPPQR
ncbi:MAG: glycosyltransferase family 2 protein [Anaerolineales bacterium]